jgi:hypothetical protein
LSLTWWYTSVIPALGRQEDVGFEASLGYIVTFNLINNNYDNNK